VKRLMRAAEAWIWSETLFRVAGLVALAVVMAAAWAVLIMAGRMI
jgi:hypothetical protein